MATAPIAPPGSTPLPTPPTTLDPVNFDARMDAWLTAQVAFQTEENALAANVFGNAQKTFDATAEVAASAAEAATSAANVSALANFKGTWASQTGAIAKPASVFHNAAFWALLNNLADVTASQPGVTADWQVCGGAFPVVVMAGNMTAKPWTSYLIPGPYTLTLPAISGTGQQVEVVVLAGVTGAIVTPAGTDKIRSTTGAMDVTAPFSATLKDTGASYGWV